MRDGLPRDPWGLWAIFGLIALIVSPRLWRESPNLTPLHWLSLVACFGALTLGLYLLSLAISGGLAIAGHAGEPSGVYRAGGFLIPVAALACVFCLARSIELRLRAVKTAQTRSTNLIANRGILSEMGIIQQLRGDSVPKQRADWGERWY